MVRQRKIQYVLLATAALAALNVASWADSAKDLRESYLESFGANASGINPMQVFSMTFQRIDRNANGIEAAEIDEVETITQAESRAQRLAMSLRQDLNGDFTVTKEEISRSIEYHSGGKQYLLGGNEQLKKQYEKQRERRISQSMRGDADGNGILEKQELYFVPEEQEASEFRRAPEIKFARALLAADPNKDGKLTQTEGALLLAQALDGVEAEVLQRANNPVSQQMKQKQLACSTIDIAPETDLVVLGAYNSESLSTVTVDGQDGETNGAGIFIEDGTKPLTVIVSAFSPMVWKFAGQTDRVQKLIVVGHANEASNGKVAAGVVGVKKEKIQFLPSGKCLPYFSDTKSTEGMMARSILAKLVKREPDVFVGKYGIDVVSLPSGAGTAEDEDDSVRLARQAKAGITYFDVGEGGKLVPRAPDGDDQDPDPLSREFSRFSRDGLMDFAPEEVVSDMKAERYLVLPQQAGLLQLIKQQKLAAIKGGFKVLGPMRFPAGLTGAHGVSFFVPKGVPVPEGDPGHSCVFIEEKAATMSGEVKC